MKEIFKKARAAKSEKELMTLARENGLELTEEEAKAYFGQLHASGELSDEELENVAGGGCHKKDGRMVVTIMFNCEHYVCTCGRTGQHSHLPNMESIYPSCETCKYCTYEKALWLCNHPAHMK